MNSPGKCVAVRVLSLILPVRVVTCPSKDGAVRERSLPVRVQSAYRAKRVKAIRTVDVDSAAYRTADELIAATHRQGWRAPRRRGHTELPIAFNVRAG